MHSFVFALIAGFVSAMFAMTAAYVVSRKQFLFRRLVDFSCILPAALPGIFFGIGYSIAFTRPPIDLYGTAAIVVLSMIFWNISMGYQTGIGTFKQISPSLGEAASNLGARSMKIFWQIVQLGSPWDIYYQPVNTFVADFVGTANLLEGRVMKTDEGSLVVSIDNAEIRINEPGEILNRGDSVTICIRPETIDVFNTVPADTLNSVKGEISNYIFEGAHICYWIKAGTRTLKVDVADPSEKGVYEGEVFLRFHPGKIYILRGDKSSPQN